MTGAEYDDFIEEFVSAVIERWPSVLLQWEDFAGSNAARLLARYRDRLCTFNDDIQGTAAVAAGSLMAAINVTGVPLTEQRIALLGAGSAGSGIAALLLRAMIDAGGSEPPSAAPGVSTAARSVTACSSRAPLPDITPAAQTPFVQSREAVAGWKLEKPGEIGLLDVVSNAKPTVLIGVSGQAGAFTEPVVRAMAQHVERPVIYFPCPIRLRGARRRRSNSSHGRTAAR